MVKAKSDKPAKTKKSAYKTRAQKLQKDFLKKLGGYDFIQSIFNSFPDTHIFVKDLKGRHIFQNDLVAEKRGYSDPLECVGKTAYDFAPGEMADKYTADDQNVYKSGQPVINRVEKIFASEGKYSWYSTTKIPLFNLKGKVVGLTGIARDITEIRRLMNKVKRQKSQLEKLSIRDPLTNAYNRRFLENEMAERFETFKRMNKTSSFLSFDLDKFKHVNDKFGHNAGDNVLVKFAGCVTGSLRRKTDILIRMGGDEFLLCLLGADGDFASKIADKIITSFKSSKWPRRVIKDSTYQASVSVGIASLQDNRESMENLLKRSDEAVYMAKKQGGNQSVHAHNPVS